MASAVDAGRKKVDIAHEENRSLSECTKECSSDIEAISKHILQFLLTKDRARKGPGQDKFVELLILFEQKLDRLKKLVELRPEYRAREELIEELKKCVDNRDGIIQKYADNLRGAEQVLTKGIFQANKKLKNMADSEENPVYSEDVIKFAHQISKSYSVAAPQFWQTGDPLRPFPTENELRQSNIGSAKSLGSLPVPQPPRSSTQFNPRLGASPSNYAVSPRNSAATGQSPKGRMTSGGGTPSGSSMGGSTPSFRGQESSPFIQKKVGVDGTTSKIPKQVGEMMSSDSSSSSSSDEER